MRSPFTANSPSLILKPAFSLPSREMSRGAPSDALVAEPPPSPGVQAAAAKPELSCNSTWSQPWQIGEWSQLGLNPFDETSLLQEQRSLVTFCEAPLGTLGPLQTEARIVPCLACPQGYEFGEDRTALRCRPTPDCSAQKCTTCQIQSTQPYFTGSCDACITYGCDPNSNRCSCG